MSDTFNEKKEWISPSDSETDALARKIMESIYPIIKSMKDEEDIPTSVRHIFSALEIANNIKKDANKAYALRYHDKYTHSYSFSTMDIIGTCICALISGDDIITYPPISQGGTYIMALCAASRLMGAVSNLESEADCCTQDEGWEIAKKIMNESL